MRNKVNSRSISDTSSKSSHRRSSRHNNVEISAASVAREYETEEASPGTYYANETAATIASDPSYGTHRYEITEVVSQQPEYETYRADRYGSTENAAAAYGGTSYDSDRYGPTETYERTTYSSDRYAPTGNVAAGATSYDRYAESQLPPVPNRESERDPVDRYNPETLPSVRSPRAAREYEAAEDSTRVYLPNETAPRNPGSVTSRYEPLSAEMGVAASAGQTNYDRRTEPPPPVRDPGDIYRESRIDEDDEDRYRRRPDEDDRYSFSEDQYRNYDRDARDRSRGRYDGAYRYGSYNSGSTTDYYSGYYHGNSPDGYRSRRRSRSRSRSRSGSQSLRRQFVAFQEEEARSLMNSEDYKAALPVVVALLADPNLNAQEREWWFFKHAEVLQMLGKWQDSLDALSRDDREQRSFLDVNVDVSPDYGRTLRMQAEATYQLRKLEEAKALCSQAISELERRGKPIQGMEEDFYLSIELMVRIAGALGKDIEKRFYQSKMVPEYTSKADLRQKQRNRDRARGRGLDHTKFRARKRLEGGAP